MGRIVRRQQIDVPSDYWESSIKVRWVYING